MGVPVRIVLYAPAEADAVRAATAAFARIAALDRDDERLPARQRRQRRRPSRTCGGRRRHTICSRSCHARSRLRGRPTARSIRPSRPSSHSGATQGQPGGLPDRAALTSARALVGWRSRRARRRPIDDSPASARHAIRSRRHRQRIHPARALEVLRELGHSRGARRGRRRSRRRRRPTRPHRLARRDLCGRRHDRTGRVVPGPCPFAHQRGRRDIGACRAIRRYRWRPLFTRHRSAHGTGADVECHGARDRSRRDRADALATAATVLGPNGLAGLRARGLSRHARRSKS